MGNDSHVCGVSPAGMGLADHSSVLFGRDVRRHSCYGIDRSSECYADSDAAYKADEWAAVAHSVFCFGEGSWFPVLLSDRRILCIMR